MKTFKPFIISWLKALRSGRYNQGLGFLKVEYTNKPTEYCCLGVLCETLNLKEVEENPKTTIKKVGNVKSFIGAPTDQDQTPYCAALPSGISKTLGFFSNVGSVYSEATRKEVKNFLINHSIIKEKNLNVDITKNNSLSLATLNDDNVPFEVIADLIEKFPTAYFQNPYES